MNVHIPAQLQRAGASPGARRAALVLAVALVASLLALLPNLGDARAATLPPLAWGNNDHGQLGRCVKPNPDTWNPRCLEPPFSATPFEVAGLVDVTQLSAGISHSLARLADGTAWAWGRNRENQLADSRSQHNPGAGVQPQDRPAPGQVYERTETPIVPPRGAAFSQRYVVSDPVVMANVAAVAAGGYHSLALKNDGTVWAWGDNWCGQLGNGKVYTATGSDDFSPPAAVQVPDLPKITAVAAGRGHSLALDEEGVLWSWGDNRWGQLGNEARPDQNACPLPEGPSGTAQIVPTRVPMTAKVVDVAAGSDHTLARTDDGKVWSWGNNCSAQLGSSLGAQITAFRSVPTEVSGLPAGQEVVALAAGGAAMGGHSVALTDAGEVWTWGLADVLGAGSAPSDLVSPCKDDPVFNSAVGDATAFTEEVGQKGRLTPARVFDSTAEPDQPLGDVAGLDAGVFHTLAVQRDGDLFAWGRNDVGQLGPLSPLRPSNPTEPARPAIKALDGTVVAVSAGSHSLTLPGGSNPATTTNTGSTNTPQTTTSGPTTTTPSTTTSSTTTTTTTPPPPPQPPSRDRVIVWGPFGTGATSRHASAMAYDVARQQTILFGGLQDDRFGGPLTYGDTWAWGGAVDDPVAGVNAANGGWSNLNKTGPLARHGHAMVYDATGERIVMFGGLDKDHVALGDTWAWNGSRWSQITDSGPSPRVFMSMAYDSDSSRVILFGGTAYWYYRACRAAVVGGVGYLSGPFADLAVPEQERAILSLLELRDDVSLPDPRLTVPAMAGIARRHPQLNLLNLEAVATARILSAEVWLSPPAASGVLPGALDAEGLVWRTVEIA